MHLLFLQFPRARFHVCGRLRTLAAGSPRAFRARVRTSRRQLRRDRLLAADAGDSDAAGSESASRPRRRPAARLIAAVDTALLTAADGPRLLLRHSAVAVALSTRVELTHTLFLPPPDSIILIYCIFVYLETWQYSLIDAEVISSI